MAWFCLQSAKLYLYFLHIYLFRNLLQPLPAKLLLNLSISLVLLLVTFLAGVEQTEPKIAFQIIATLIQYFILTTFSWMGVEAFNMYRRLWMFLIQLAEIIKFYFNILILTFSLTIFLMHNSNDGGWADATTAVALRQY